MTQPERTEQQRRNLEFNLAAAHQASRTTRQMMDIGGPDLPKLELDLGHLIGLTDHRDPLMAVTLRQEGKPDRGVVMLQSDLRTLPEGVTYDVARPCTPEANLIASRLLRNRDPGVALRALVYLATHAEIREVRLATGVIHHRAGNDSAPDPFL